MRKFLRDLLLEEEGASAVEYALLAALIATAIFASVALLGTSLSGSFNNIASSLGAAS